MARTINPKSMATAAADVVDQKIGWVKEAAGDRFDELELQLQVFVTRVTDDPMPFAEKLAPAFGLPPEVVLQAPYFQIGTIDQIAENLQACGTAGASATSPSSRTPRRPWRRWWPSSAAPEAAA